MLQAEKKFYRSSEVWASGFKTIVIKDKFDKHLIVAGAMFISEAGYIGTNSTIIYSGYAQGSMFDELEKLKNIYFERK